MNKFLDSNLFINTWHIHNPNGMLYYCLSYLNNLKTKKTKIILVRNNINSEQIRKNLKNKDYIILKLSIKKYFIFYIYLLVKTYLFKTEIFTPSPHPLPLLKKQTIVIHDSYAFKRINIAQNIKYYLLKFCLFFSETNIVYINHQDSLLFSKRISSFSIFKKIKLIYTPNKIDILKNINLRKNCEKDKLYIGLSGSDSYKKNYEILIKDLIKMNAKNIEFVIFGFENNYTKALNSISSYKIQILDSSINKIENFLESIDYIVNLSKEEGFCRPIAYANSVGIKLLTIDTPVMREFYNNKNTYFFKEYYEIAKYIVDDISKNN